MKHALPALLLFAGGCDRLFAVPFTPDAFECTKLASDLDDADADCVADELDNCPGYANFDQADSEGDGVGDACDPDPDARGDSLLEFEDFDDPVAAALAWQESGTTGRFMYEVGGVVHPVEEGGSYLQRAAPVPDSAEVLVEIAFRFDAWGDRVNYPRVRLYVDEGAVPTQGLYCAVDASNDNLAMREQLVLGDPVGGATVSTIARLEGTHTIRMRMHRRADLLSCDIFVDDELTALPDHPRGAGTWPTTRGAGITFSRVQARLDWITVYTATRD